MTDGLAILRTELDVAEQRIETMEWCFRPPRAGYPIGRSRSDRAIPRKATVHVRVPERAPAGSRVFVGAYARTVRRSRDGYPQGLTGGRGNGMIDTQKYEAGTELRSSYPWGLYVGGRALCSDGKVRALSRIAQTADTFFSVPASVKVDGRTVSGYVTTETAQGFTTESAGDPTVVKFVAYTYGRNADALPAGKWAGMLEVLPV